MCIHISMQKTREEYNTYHIGKPELTKQERFRSPADIQLLHTGIIQFYMQSTTQTNKDSRDPGAWY